MNLPFDAPEAHARRSDPETSHLAADAVTPGLNAIQRLVEGFARSKIAGFLDVDLVAALPDHGPSTLRTRRAELVERNVILDSGKRQTPEGASSPHTVWIHRNFVAGAAPVRDAPPPKAIAEGKADGLATAARLEAFSRSVKAEGRSMWAQALLDEAAVVRRLVALLD